MEIPTLTDGFHLVVDAVAHVGGNAFGVARGRAGPDELGEIFDGGLALRDQFVGIFVFQFIEREGASIGDLDRAIDCLRVLGEEAVETALASWPTSSLVRTGIGVGTTSSTLASRL